MFGRLCIAGSLGSEVMLGESARDFRFLHDPVHEAAPDGVKSVGQAGLLVKVALALGIAKEKRREARPCLYRRIDGHLEFRRPAVKGSLAGALGRFVTLDQDSGLGHVCRSEPQKVSARHPGHKFEPEVRLDHPDATFATLAVEFEHLLDFPVLDVSVTRWVVLQSHLADKRMSIDVTPLHCLGVRVTKNLDLTATRTFALLCALFGESVDVPRLDILDVHVAKHEPEFLDVGPLRGMT